MTVSFNPSKIISIIYIEIQFLPYRSHQINQLIMLFREIITMYCGNHISNAFVHCVGKMQSFLNVEIVGTYSQYHTLND